MTAIVDGGTKVRSWLLLGTVCAVALSACGDKRRGQHQLAIEFPSQALMGATSRVEVDVVAAGAKPCAELVLDGAAGLQPATRLKVEFPSSAAPAIESLPSGSYLVLVAAFNRAAPAQRFLAGCAAAEIDASRALEIKIELAEVRGRCAANAPPLRCYDGPPGTDGKGVCRAGSASCQGGRYGSCIGQQLAQSCEAVDARPADVRPADARPRELGRDAGPDRLRPPEASLGCKSSAECSDALSPVCSGGKCQPCASSVQCSDKNPAKPHCSSGSCVACLSSAHCPNPTPICSANVCGACALDSQCSQRDPTAPVCVAGTGCVGCKDHGHCSGPKKPTCTASNTCIADCTSMGADDCTKYHPGFPWCEAATGMCVECEYPMDCLDPKKPICELATFSCRGCASNNECADEYPTRPICSGGACGGCKSNADCSDPAKPICKLDGSCSTCETDAQCAELCDRATGKCVTAASAIWVDPSSTTCPGAGTQASPYCALASALNAAPTDALVVAAAGPHVLPGQLAISTPGVHIRPPKGGGQVVIEGNACPLIALGAGISAYLESVVVRGTGAPAAGGGISASGGKLTLMTSTVGPGSCIGLNVTGSLSLERSLVTRNTGGGVKLVVSGTTPKIQNSFIVRNGGATSDLGGLSISYAGLSSILSYSTIAFNTAKAGTVGGVAGHSTYKYGAASACVVWGNSGNQVSAGSYWSSSDIDDATGYYSCYSSPCLRVDPKFADPAADNFHLGAGSPCIDQGSTSPATMVDFDGDTRPLGGKADLGADEYKP